MIHRTLSHGLVAVLLVIGASAVLKAGSTATQQKANAPSADQELIAASNRWFAALLRNDVETLRMLEGNDFVTIQTTARGVMVLEKSAQLDSLKQAPAPSIERRRELGNVKIRHYDRTAILTATATLRGEPAAGNPPQAVITEVWTNTNGKWQIVHFQPVDVPVIRSPRAGGAN